ncbi:MAG: asparagine synthase-related protein [Syntrophotaleaceae bacterium]
MGFLNMKNICRNTMDKYDLDLSVFERYKHLGSDYPYYFEADPGHFHYTVESALRANPKIERSIDPVGIVEMLSRGNLLGQRTLLKGLRKAPWRAVPDGRGGWDYAEIPKHGRAIIPDGELVRRFREALEREGLIYLNGRKRVGILLSGGMDSRIVAGIVKVLQLRGDFPGEVVGITWGIPGSRDMAYSAEVAKRLGWEQLEFQLNPEQLLENIHVAGEMGAEFAPYHLHALPKVANLKNFDAIIFGNYGDGVGRAEYSGVRVEALKPLVGKNLNRYGLVLDSVLEAARTRIHEDAYGHRINIQRDLEYQYREIEYQMNCIRRRSQAVASCVGKHIPIFQMFTSPDVFGLVWGLDPSVRDDRIYKGLLEVLPGKLGEIPWARTGRVFGMQAGESDTRTKEYHRYGQWLRNDLRKEVLCLVNSDVIRELGVFNEASLDAMIQIWPKAKTVTTNHIDENIGWLASLSVFINRYGIGSKESGKRNLADVRNTLLGSFRGWTYLSMRNRYRH